MSPLEGCTHLVSTADKLTLLINIIIKREGPAQDKLRRFCSTTRRNAEMQQQTRLMTPPCWSQQWNLITLGHCVLSQGLPGP